MAAISSTITDRKSTNQYQGAAVNQLGTNPRKLVLDLRRGKVLTPERGHRFAGSHRPEHYVDQSSWVCLMAGCPQYYPLVSLGRISDSSHHCGAW